MSSTQRSENINGYFDGYINARTTLKKFVEQYEAALTKKVEIEKEDDATSWKTFIPLISSYDLETQFQSVYTHNKVREFQDEIRRILNCQVWTRSNIEYEIKEWISFEEGGDKYKKRVSCKVLFNEDTEETKCNCRLFEFKGMVCAHQLMVWNDKGISKVPEKYVFKRWCKNVKMVHSKVPISYDKSSNGIESCRRKNMYNIFKDVVELAEGCKNKYEKVMTQCRELKREFDDEASGSDRPTHDDCGSLEDVLVPSKQSITIRDPEPTRGRGRTPYKRKLSIADKISKAKAKKTAVVGRIRKNVVNKINKRLPTNENKELQSQVVGWTQCSISTLTPYIRQCINEPSLQNYVPTQAFYMSSPASECCNVPQVNALNQSRQMEGNAGSQINPMTSQWMMPTFEKDIHSPYVDG